jgi:hypothetical protein
LYDQPLNVIQSYIKGKWRLQYIYGGLLAKKHIDSYNSYLILSSDHITRGNDSTGVIVDTTIVWVRAKVWGNDSTYLLSYSWRGYNWPEYYIIDQIKDDTLIIKDYVDDGFNYYYTKF